MEDLGAPQPDENMNDRAPTAADLEPVREDRGQIGPFGVEGARGLLDVRELGSILDVEQGTPVSVPRDDIGPAGELVVLIGLVDRDAIAERSEVPRLELAHRGVNEVLIAAAALLPLCPTRLEGKRRPRAERERDPGIGSERGGLASLESMKCRSRDSGPQRDLAK